MPMSLPVHLLRAGLFALFASASLVAGAADGHEKEDASALDRPLPAVAAPAAGLEVDESQFSTDTAPPALDPDYRQPAAEATSP